MSKPIVSQFQEISVGSLLWMRRTSLAFRLRYRYALTLENVDVAIIRKRL